MSAPHGDATPLPPHLTAAFDQADAEFDHRTRALARAVLARHGAPEPSEAQWAWLMLGAQVGGSSLYAMLQAGGALR